LPRTQWFKRLKEIEPHYADEMLRCEEVEGCPERLKLSELEEGDELVSSHTLICRLYGFLSRSGIPLVGVLCVNAPYRNILQSWCSFLVCGTDAPVRALWYCRPGKEHQHQASIARYLSREPFTERNSAGKPWRTCPNLFYCNHKICAVPCKVWR
jgi:hypothetical protein